MEKAAVAANNRQVGGEHYKADYQHWDLVTDTGMGYFEGQVTKYVVRWRKKNGVEDPKKALHYLDKLIELRRERRYPASYHGAVATAEKALEQFRRQHPLEPTELLIVQRLIFYRSTEDLVQIRPQLELYIQQNV